MRIGKCLRTIVGALLLVTAFASWGQQSSRDLERTLRQLVQKDFLVLQHPYRGDHLQFAPDGQATGSPEEGTWPGDSTLRVTGVNVKGLNATIKGDRMIFYYGVKGDLRAARSNRRITIELSFPAEIRNEAAVAAVLDRIFYRDTKHMPAMPPAPSELGSDEYEIRDTPHGVWMRKKGASEWQLGKDISDVIPVAELEGGRKVFLYTKPLTIPKIVRQVEPDFPESERKKAKQGLCVLDLIIDSAGMPRSIRVRKSEGVLFDDAALRAVTQWQFEPATLNGQPVAVLISIEVNFRLF